MHHIESHVRQVILFMIHTNKIKNDTMCREIKKREGVKRVIQLAPGGWRVTGNDLIKGDSLEKDLGVRSNMGQKMKKRGLGRR